jgi:hypothetical protein
MKQPCARALVPPCSIYSTDHRHQHHKKQHRCASFASELNAKNCSMHDSVHMHRGSLEPRLRFSAKIFNSNFFDSRMCGLRLLLLAALSCPVASFLSCSTPVLADSSCFSQVCTCGVLQFAACANARVALLATRTVFSTQPKDVSLLRAACIPFGCSAC